MNYMITKQTGDIIHYGVAHDENPPGRGSGRYAYGSTLSNVGKKIGSKITRSAGTINKSAAITVANIFGYVGSVAGGAAIAGAIDSSAGIAVGAAVGALGIGTVGIASAISVISYATMKGVSAALSQNSTLNNLTNATTKALDVNS